MEQKLSETVDKLKELAEEQEKLSKESNEKNADSEKISEKQQAIKEEFDNLKQKLDEIEELSKEAGEDMDLSDTKEKEKKADQNMNKSMENLKQDKPKKASENQKDAAKDMKEMAEQLEQMMSAMQMEQMEEDMRALRQLLENLIKLSFDQEDLIYAVRGTSINNPEYIELVQKQHKLQDDTKVVEDSLYALSKRVFQIESFITQEMTNIKKNIRESIDHLEERRTQQSMVNQQHTMTGFNNLALMLSEVMEQMQQQMAGQMAGMQMCQGKKKGLSLPGMRELQEQLNDQIGEMQKQLKEGGKPDKQGMSQKLAQMAAQQAAIREALKKLAEQENRDGKKSLGDLDKIIEEMDKTETDLVNKQLTEQMLMRQQEILTRLLEAEKSMRERDTKEERLSQTAQDEIKKIPPSLEEYLKKRESEVELYKTVPPSLLPYYKSLVEKYFKSISF